MALFRGADSRLIAAARVAAAAGGGGDDVESDVDLADQEPFRPPGGVAG